MGRKRDPPLVKHKRVERIFGILERTDSILHVIGSGPHEKSLQRAAASRGVENKVIFHGALGDEDRNRMMEISDHVILPSEMDAQTGGYEGFGITALEAVALGTLPILSGHEGLDDLLSVYGIGERGLTSDQDVERTVALMAEYKDEDKYKKHIDDARTTIANHLTWKHIVERMWC
jgi:glycosyltransferase involved in cell wall biosynthesis